MGVQTRKVIWKIEAIFFTKDKVISQQTQKQTQTKTGTNKKQLQEMVFFFILAVIIFIVGCGFMGYEYDSSMKQGARYGYEGQPIL